MRNFSKTSKKMFFLIVVRVIGAFSDIHDGADGVKIHKHWVVMDLLTKHHVPFRFLMMYVKEMKVCVEK